MSIWNVDKVIKRIELFSLSAALAEFRRWLELESGEAVQNLEVNAAVLLNDLCRFLTLDDTQRRQALGESAAAYVEEVMNERIDLTH